MGDGITAEDIARQCTGKAGVWIDELQAQRAATRLRRKSGLPFRSYKCQFCPWYHVSSKSKEKKR